MKFKIVNRSEEKPVLLSLEPSSAVDGAIVVAAGKPGSLITLLRFEPDGTLMVDNKALSILGITLNIKE